MKEPGALNPASLAPLAIGAAVAFLAGLVALKLLIGILTKGAFHRFAYYLLPVGNRGVQSISDYRLDEIPAEPAARCGHGKWGAQMMRARAIESLTAENLTARRRSRAP